eukprot:754191-Hanusia_phi.AAC.6
MLHVSGSYHRSGTLVHAQEGIALELCLFRGGMKRSMNAASPCRKEEMHTNVLEPRERWR